MRQQIQDLLAKAVGSLVDSRDLDLDVIPEIQISVPRSAEHGDFSTNIAMVLAKPCRLSPRLVAERIVGAVGQSDLIADMAVEGPGFINITLNADAFRGVIDRVLKQGTAYGRSDAGQGKRVLIEFVSANPTGPLHIGHGRGAAYGAVIASLLDAAGYKVSREYYVNDAGRQIDILAFSVWLRYLQRLGHDVSLPPNAYQGDYITDIALALNELSGNRFERAFGPSPSNSDPEALIDEWIARCRTVLGAEHYAELLKYGCDHILAWIRRDLSDFGVEYDTWYSERSLMEKGLIDRALTVLRGRRFVYRKDGAEWFRASELGDEKDRVVIRDNGSETYFASDIAYHMEKYERGFDQIINVWGADHHGYVPRIKAAIVALDKDPNRLEVVLVQFASLFRAGEKVQMSTRSGEFVTLAELIQDVGRDAARFFYVTRRSDQHLDFDVDLAKSRSNENPVYYIQYAHARICSVFRQLEQKGLEFNAAHAVNAVGVLTEERERALTSLLSRYPDIVDAAAHSREPHQLASYLRDLANEFHVYYNTHKIITDDADLRNARLALAVAVKTVISNGLGLLGVGAPAEM